MAPELIGLATLICQIVLKAMEGQSPEQRQKMWDWYIQDVTAWRKFWGLE